MSPAQRERWIEAIRLSQRAGLSMLEMLDERREDNAARGEPPYAHDEQLRQTLEPLLAWYARLLDALRAGLDEPDLPHPPAELTPPAERR